MARSESKRRFSGVSRNQRVRIDTRRDDTRTFGQRMIEQTSTTGGTLGLFGLLASLALLLSWAPFIPEMLFLIALVFFIRYYRFGRKLWDMPFRVPAYLNRRIPGMKTVLDASTRKKAEGNLYLGIDEETNEEVWASTDDVNKHVLIIGTTGSGKTETIMANVFGLMALGSGALLVDGKASANTYDSIYKAGRILGREVDLLAMDYLVGGKDVIGPQQDRRSHTYNPLTFGGSSQKAEVILSLLDSDGDMWSGRAISFVEGIMPPLAYLADRGYVLLNPDLLAEYFLLENIENLVLFGVFTDLNGNVVDLKNESRAEWEELQARCKAIEVYLENLPSYSICRPARPVPGKKMTEEMVQSLEAKYGKPDAGEGDAGANARQKVSEQHGYITMQLVRAINNLSNNFGFIYGSEIGEISFQDVVLNRRSMIVLLPAMERTKSNIEQLGKLTVLSLKTVLGALINTRSEGSRREIIDGNPSNSRIPFGAILDEVGSYMVPGISIIPAQARSLGVSVYFGTQAIPDLMKANADEGKAIIDNTALKFFGRLTGDEESDTARTAINMGGKTHVQIADSMHYEQGMGLGQNLKLEERSTLQEQHQISYSDLVNQEAGQFHLVVGSKELDDRGYQRGGQRVVRMQSFYTGNIDNVMDWRRNPFVIVKPPSIDEVVSIREAEMAARALRRSIASVLTDPSAKLLERAKEVQQTMYGQFLAHRRAETERGEWPTGREERAQATEEWFARYFNRIRVEQSLLSEASRHKEWVRSLKATAATARLPEADKIFVAGNALAADWHRAFMGRIKVSEEYANEPVQIPEEAVLRHQEAAREAARHV